MAETALPAQPAGQPLNTPPKIDVKSGLALDLPGAYGSGWTVAGTDVSGNVILSRPNGETLNNITISKQAYERVRNLRVNKARASQKTKLKIFQTGQTFYGEKGALSVIGYDAHAHRTLMQGFVDGRYVQQWVDAGKVNGVVARGQEGLQELLQDEFSVKKEPTDKDAEKERREKERREKEKRPVTKGTTVSETSTGQSVVEPEKGSADQTKKTVEEDSEIEVLDEAIGAKAEQQSLDAVRKKPQDEKVVETKTGEEVKVAPTTIDRSIGTTLQLMREQHADRLREATEGIRDNTAAEVLTAEAQAEDRKAVEGVKRSSDEALERSVELHRESQENADEVRTLRASLERTKTLAQSLREQGDTVSLEKVERLQQRWQGQLEKAELDMAAFDELNVQANNDYKEANRKFLDLIYTTAAARRDQIAPLQEVQVASAEALAAFEQTHAEQLQVIRTELEKIEKQKISVNEKYKAMSVNVKVHDPGLVSMAQQELDQLEQARQQLLGHIDVLSEGEEQIRKARRAARVATTAAQAIALPSGSAAGAAGVQALIAGATKEIAQLTQQIDQREGEKRALEQQIAQASQQTQQLEARWLEVAGSNDESAANEVELLYRQAEAAEEGLRKQQAIQIAQLTDLQSSRSSLQNKTQAVQQNAAPENVQSLSAQLPASVVATLPAVSGVPTAGVSAAALSATAPSSAGGVQIPTSVPLVPPRRPPLPRPEMGMLGKLSVKFGRPVALAGAMMAGQAMDRGERRADSPDAYEAAMSKEGGLGSARPLPTYTDRPRAEEGEDLMPSDSADRQKMASQMEQMKQSQESLLGPTYEAEQEQELAQEEEAEREAEEEEEEMPETQQLQGRGDQRQQQKGPTDRAKQEMDKAKEFQKKTQEARKQADQVKKVGKQAQQAQKSVQSAAKAGKAAGQGFRAAEIGSGLTVIGLILTFIMMNLQLINDRTLKLPFIPKLNFLELGLVLWVDMNICCGACLQNCIPITILVVLAGGLAKMAGLW